jgi:hypothetical protein
MLMTKDMVNKTLSAMKLSPAIMYSDQVYKKRRSQNMSVPLDYRAPKSAEE